MHNIEEIAGHGIRGTVHGHDVYAGNEKLMNKIGVDITEKHPEGTVVYMAIDNQYAGCIVISDVIKETSKAAIQSLKSQGIKETIMLTDVYKRQERTRTFLKRYLKANG